MTPELGDYVMIGLVAAIVTCAVTPLVRWFAPRLGWVAEPNARSVHTAPIPHVGGLAMYVGFLAALATAWQLGRFEVLFDTTTEPLGIVLAVTVMFLMGLVDDIVDLPPPAKVTGTVVAGVILYWFGATMFYFRVPFYDVLIVPDDWAPLITVVWLLGMTQAINLIDGLDGLAAGIVTIGAAGFFLYADKLASLGLLAGANLGPLIAVITAGVAFGFLPHNFNPAKIFMGDGGAMLLGTLLAVSTSVVGGRAAPGTQDHVGQTFFFFAPLVIPLLILGVPILDTVFAFVRRVSRRQAFDVADKGHLHHRLMNLGHGHRRSVLILWGWTLLLTSFVLWPVLRGTNPSWLTFVLGALAIGLYTVLHPMLQRRRAVEMERVLDRPAAEQVAPDRPERREAHDDDPAGAPADAGADGQGAEPSADDGTVAVAVEDVAVVAGEVADDGRDVPDAS